MFACRQHQEVAVPAGVMFRGPGRALGPFTTWGRCAAWAPLNTPARFTAWTPERFTAWARLTTSARFMAWATG